MFASIQIAAAPFTSPRWGESLPRTRSGVVITGSPQARRDAGEGAQVVVGSLAEGRLTHQRRTPSPRPSPPWGEGEGVVVAGPELESPSC